MIHITNVMLGPAFLSFQMYFCINHTKHTSTKVRNNDFRDKSSQNHLATRFIRFYYRIICCCVVFMLCCVVRNASSNKTTWYHFSYWFEHHTFLATAFIIQLSYWWRLIGKQCYQIVQYARSVCVLFEKKKKKL